MLMLFLVATLMPDPFTGDRIHWVLLKRYDKERNSCNEPTENIKRKAEDTVRQASMANQTEVPSSLNRGSRYDTELHIVKTIEVRI